MSWKIFLIVYNITKFKSLQSRSKVDPIRKRSISLFLLILRLIDLYVLECLIDFIFKNNLKKIFLDWKATFKFECGVFLLMHFWIMFLISNKSLPKYSSIKVTAFLISVTSPNFYTRIIPAVHKVLLSCLGWCW